jgi:hypothetical protein
MSSAYLYIMLNDPVLYSQVLKHHKVSKHNRWLSWFLVVLLICNLALEIKLCLFLRVIHYSFSH